MPVVKPTSDENYLGAHFRQAASVLRMFGHFSRPHAFRISSQRRLVWLRCRVRKWRHPPQVWPAGPLPVGHGWPLGLGLRVVGDAGGSQPNKSGMRNVDPALLTVLDPSLLQD